MSPAQTLLSAAALMRERAQSSAHFTAPWNIGASERGWLIGYTTDNPQAGLVAKCADYVPLATADHIASWHPTVALSVAYWLEVTARDVGTSTLAYHAALVVARVYLGESS